MEMCCLREDYIFNKIKIIIKIKAVSIFKFFPLLFLVFIYSEFYVESQGHQIRF